MSAINYTPDEFRVCPVTSFRIQRDAQLLMIANAVVAILCLSLGGVMAFLMGLQKSPNQVWSLLKNNIDYYQVVTLHGLNMLIFWMVFFEMALIVFVVTVFLNTKLFSLRLGWLSFALMVIGMLMLNLIVGFGGERNWVMFTAYYPLQPSWVFYLGYIIFAVGALVQCINFFLTIYHAKKSGTYPHKSLPLVVYGTFAAVVIAVQAIINGAIAMIIAFLYTLLPNANIKVSADFWKQVFWGFGHTAQYINISATAAVWYTLIAISTGAKPLSEKFSRTAFFLYLVFTVPVATHHLIVDPAYSMPFKLINATILALGLAIPSLIHAFVIPGALERQMRILHKDDEEVTGSLFGWIKKLPWMEHPAIPAIFWSVILFGIGGMMGSIQGTYQLNLITHNTLRINSHFHLTVVAGSTVAFMAIAYYFIELIPRRKIILGNLKSIQIHLYSFGLLILATGMFIAGVQGAPRRTSTYEYYAMDNATLPNWNLGHWILTIGALIAVAGGVIFVFLTVFSLFFGKKLDPEGDWNSPIPGIAPKDEKEENTTKLHAPGTLAIGLLFMIAFAVFFITTYIVLSLGWQIGRLSP